MENGYDLDMSDGKKTLTQDWSWHTNATSGAA